ncbi:YeeE/YedE thiosulfate transporter family protein [Desulfitobacterium sp.]|uniref:YeeE/YedE thiosulfate transporter family protein n=1 Tax=Desulfitobacterium sp. TaxID=49981 RepID=UPI002BDA7235|nr:YeeE/YedE thiosulfate transporter family protein [Desulfitobacterium sp.]HVJ49481.1 YeeE/YedE thiosulfate transporter family protein [Desulfitobacterium sp.]
MVKSQRKWNIAFSAFMGMLFLTLMQVNLKIALIFVLGTGLGFTLQKSRFCFVSAFRDPMITGITEITRAVILLIGLSILGFGVVYQISEWTHLSLSLNIFPLGFSTIAGGVLFGVGMVLAGGCVSGVLMRIGEGFGMQMVALVGLLIGVLAGKSSLAFWRGTFGEWPGIFIPAFLGWIPTIIFELLLLGGLWKLAYWWQNKHLGE